MGELNEHVRFGRPDVSIWSWPLSGGCIVSIPPSYLPKRRSRRLFDTTKTLEKAMAAPAMSGFR